MKTSIYNQFNILVATTPMFAIEKAKIAKDILDKKITATITPAAGTAIPAL